MNLHAFKGKVSIEENTFDSNIFRFETCDEESVDLEFDDKEDFKNNFDRVHRLPNSKFNKVQIKSLINIMNHHDVV